MLENKKRDIYAITKFDSLNDLIKNISYVSKSSDDFTEEIKIVKKIICKCLDEKRYEEINEFLRGGINRINNNLFFESLILMFYDVKHKYLQDLKTIVFIQDRFYELLEDHFKTTKTFSPKLNTSGLHLKQFLDLRYLSKFKETNDDKWLQDYSYLIQNTIKKIYSLCGLILVIDMESNAKKTYLETQLEELNKVLEYFDRRSNQLEENEIKSKLKNNARESLIKRELELFYLILYHIENNKLSKDFFDVALKLYNYGEFSKRGYYEHLMFDDLDWLNYNTWSGGGQTISNFNQNKYRLLISLYKYINENELDINKFRDENFANYATPSFEDNLAKIDENSVKRYFDFKTKDFTSFKKKIAKEIKNRKKRIKETEEDYIASSDLNSKYINKFIEDCRNVWNKNQEEMSLFIKIENVNGGESINEFFGQYTLCDKIWFIDSKDKNVGIDRSLGLSFGRDQIISKKNKILESIGNTFNKSMGDKEILTSEIYQDLSKIIEREKEYYFFYNSDANIYEIPNLDWVRSGGETALLKLNNSTIHFIHANIPKSLLIEKEEFVLKQYKKGYENHNEPLYVSAEKINEADAKKIIESGKLDFKSTKDVMKKIKIRIAEKFEIKRKQNGGKMFIINIKK